MASQHFSSCILTPVPPDEISWSNVTPNADGTWKTSSFYLDSSRRSSVVVPLKLKFDSKHSFDQLVATNCFDPFLKLGKMDDKEEGSSRYTFSIEAKVTLTFGTGEAIAAAVENVSVRFADMQQDSILFDTEVTVRVSRSEGGRISSYEASRVKTNLEISAVLSERLPDKSHTVLAVEGLKALNLGGFPELGQTTGGPQRVQRTRLPPCVLRVSLTNGLTISAESIPSPVMGQTYVSLSMKHSNMHSDVVTVTDIALHPGHSVEEGQNQESAREITVTDMSKAVKWIFASQCDPKLPLTIGPHESYSTVIVVDALEDKRVRTFLSPISVTASVGKPDRLGKKHSIVAASNVKWTTTRAAVEPADAFRVDLSLDGERGIVGSPLTVVLDITNVSTDDKDLMILVDYSGETGLALEKKKTVKIAAVSEKGGNKFGVWGLVDDGCPNDRDEQEQELLVIDAAILLGVVKASSSKHAGIRFIPLRKGTLRIPAFKLVDRRRGRWYSCVHNLRLVVSDA